ncbi:MAG: DUF3015 domain-containing protein [Proteobacteria bacterium]|nr:DUF3015 domain-containing protein [Pseudomonadota bacterium]
MIRTYLLAGAALVLVAPNLASANRKYGMAGCGLGSVVMGPKGSQVSAWTTNGTSGTQIYGITTGTSNCTQDSNSEASLLQQSYMLDNYAALSREMAQGTGDTLAGLANVLGCNEGSKDAFNRVAKDNFKEIFASPGAVAALNTLKENIQKNGNLAKDCQFAAVTSDDEVK